MKTLIIEVEDDSYSNILNILNNFKVKVIQNDSKLHAINKKKYSKQDILNRLTYQGSTMDSKNIDELIYS